MTSKQRKRAILVIIKSFICLFLSSLPCLYFPAVPLEGLRPANSRHRWPQRPRAAQGGAGPRGPGGAAYKSSGGAGGSAFPRSAPGPALRGGTERERPGSARYGPAHGRLKHGAAGAVRGALLAAAAARPARRWVHVSRVISYRRGSGLFLVAGVGPTGSRRRGDPPYSPPGVVPMGESEPGRGDGGWEGSTQLFLCREPQTERRSGAAGNAVTRGRPVLRPVGRSPAHPPAVRCIGAAAPRTTHSGERLAPSLENPRVPASGTRIGLLNFFVRKENLSGSVGLRQHAWFNELLVRGPPRAVPPPGGALPVPAVLLEEVGAG